MKISKNRKLIALGVATTLSVYALSPAQESEAVNPSLVGSVVSMNSVGMVIGAAQLAVDIADLSLELYEYNRENSTSLNTYACSLLENIQNLSELSTYEVKYNGIATATELVTVKKR